MAIMMMVEISPSGVCINKQVKHNSKQMAGEGVEKRGNLPILLLGM